VIRFGGYCTYRVCCDGQNVDTLKWWMRIYHDWISAPQRISV
jgi:hypothetical protein